MFRKVRAALKLIASLFLNLLALPIVLLVVALRPFVLVRFGTLISKRIGHFAADTEAYLCARDRVPIRSRIVDFIGCPEPVCNHQLYKMFRRTIHIAPFWRLWNIIDRACLFFTHTDTHHVKLYDRNEDYKYRIGTEPHLSFTDEERELGWKLLLKMGVPVGSKWVCIHNRDSSYIDKTFGGRSEYHDYRDFSIQSMMLAAEELSRRGYYVFRVGSVVAEKLVSDNPKIIDYASSSFRCDFLDVYLLGNSTFHLGCDSGISCVPMIFRQTVGLTNFSLLSALRYMYSPFIYKRMWHKNKGRFLSMREIFESGLSYANKSYQYKRADVELICNSPQEILDFAVEIEDRLQGRWEENPEDEVLQKQFWNLYRQFVPSAVQGGNDHFRIGAAYLRKHIDLLN